MAGVDYPGANYGHGSMDGVYQDQGGVEYDEGSNGGPRQESYENGSPWQQTPPARQVTLPARQVIVTPPTGQETPAGQETPPVSAPQAQRRALQGRPFIPAGLAFSKVSPT